MLLEELLHAIRSVYKGKNYYDPAIVERALKYDDRQETGLTPRELEVLGELGKGMSKILISENLQISKFTVKKHMSNIFAKLNVSGRTEAALYANSKGRSEY